MNGIVRRYSAIPSNFNWSQHRWGCRVGRLIAVVVSVVVGVSGVGHLDVSVSRAISERAGSMVSGNSLRDLLDALLHGLLSHAGVSLSVSVIVVVSVLP